MREDYQDSLTACCGRFARMGAITDLWKSERGLLAGRRRLTAFADLRQGVDPGPSELRIPDDLDRARDGLARCIRDEDAQDERLPVGDGHLVEPNEHRCRDDEVAELDKRIAADSEAKS
jgi:hypothetical protein